MFRTFRLLPFLLLGVVSIVAIACKEPTRPDTRPPRISIVTPHKDDLIKEPAKIIADATDNREVASVTFLVDEQVVLRDSVPNFGFLWHPAFWADGELHSLSAIATDASGNQTQSRSVAVRVSPEAREAPQLLFPANHAVLEEISRARLRWKTQPSAVSYRFAVATDTAFERVIYSEEISDTTTLTPSLKPGEYYWIVVALNRLGLSGAWSYYRQFTVKAPAVPTILAPADPFFYKSDDRIQLDWEPVANALRYEIRVWPMGNSRKSLIETQTERNMLAIELAPEIWYQWQLRAGNAGDLWSAWTKPRSFFVPAKELLHFTTVPSGEYIYGPDFRIEFIEYHFEIMRYPVTCSQYLLFLNQAFTRGAIDKNAQGYYAGDEAFAAGDYSYLDIQSRQPEFGDISYDPQKGYFVLEDPKFANHPVADVSWFSRRPHGLQRLDWCGVSAPGSCLLFLDQWTRRSRVRPVCRCFSGVSR